MKTRATNPNRKEFERYSRLGVYKPWLQDFEAFFEHVGERTSAALTLERIDNSVGYFPGNVCWANRGAQARNTRRNVKVRVNGKLLLAVDAARVAGVSRGVLDDFIHHRRKAPLPGVLHDA